MPDERIQSYGIIGDGRAAALVSIRGSIDWLCWPQFDAPSLFAALLDPERGGHFSIAPTAPCRAEHEYIEDTNVLVTRFATVDGSVALVDLMPIADEAENAGQLAPENALVRRVVCDSGELEIDVRFEPRPDYALAPVRLRESEQGLRLALGAELYLLRSDVPLQIVDGGRAATARFQMRAGQAVTFWLVRAVEAPIVLPPLGAYARVEIDRTVRYWRRWIGRCKYEGPYVEAVRRSALALKLLSFPPSGAMVAAATTSLPERLGGELNWDYRFCWLRDAAFTVRAFLELGYFDEAAAFVDWLIHTTRLTRPELRVLYDVFGRPPRGERELTHLSGHRGSRPVRVGNAADEQLQLDVYGEVIDAVAQLVRHGYSLDRDTQRMLRDFGKFVSANWRRPDSSLWEFRGPAREYTHARLLCWTALDRLLELSARGALRRCPVARFSEERDRLRIEIESRGWNDRLGIYSQVLDGDTADASTLLFGWYGFHDARSARLGRNYRAICERLGAGPGLVYRYEQSRAAGEGAFGICSFWIAEYLARGGGSREEASAWIDQMLAYTNDLGLFAEEIDPRTGEALGNVPQAFSHVGLINAAITLAAREREDARSDSARPAQPLEVSA